MQNTGTKDSKEIKIIALDDRTAVRKRTGMYFGSTDKADITLREIIDNCIDECFQSDCNRIDVRTDLPGGWRVVADWGRGIPITMTQSPNGNMITQTELAYSVLSSGSKFDKDESTIAVGMNGVGSSCVNFTSEHFYGISKVTKQNFDKTIKFDVPKKLDDYFYVIHFKQGLKDYEAVLPRTEIEKRIKSDTNIMIDIPKGCSTCVVFRPDPEIWTNVESEYSTQNLKYTKVVLEKFYNKQLNFFLNGELQDAIYEPKKFEFQTVCKVADKVAKFYITFELSNDLSITDYTGSVNSLRVPMGLHMNAARDAYTKALKSIYSIQHDNIRNGLMMDVVCLTPETDYSSQQKINLVKASGLTITDLVKSLEPSFRKIIKDNPNVFDLHVERLNEYAESISKISGIQKVKNLISTVGGNQNRVRSKLPKSVKDCTTSKRDDAELFIVEGRSAAGGILKMRDPKTQSVFSLRGVTMNAVGIDLDTIMQNEECKAIISTIGSGVDAYHKAESIRYGKIIISTDADVDGFHIASLILGLLGSQMRYLIKLGRVFITQSPLYEQDGVGYYAGEEDKLNKNKPYIRMKGLGEMSDEQVYRYLVNPKTRRLIQITDDDIKTALQYLNSSYIRKQLMIDYGQITDPYNTGIK